MQIHLYDLMDAMDSIREDEVYYYSIQDEEIVYDLAEDADPAFFIELPTKREINDYQNMSSFVDTVQDESKRDWFVHALQGKGAFRRFRATLERFGMESEWYDYLDACHRDTAIAWCENHGIVYDLQQSADEEFSEDEQYPIAATVKEQPKIPLRIVKMNDDNYMSALSVCDGYLQDIARVDQQQIRSDYAKAQHYLEQCLFEKKVVYFISDHGRYIAMIVCKKDQDGWKVSDLSVSKDRRRRGIATYLIHEVENLLGSDLQFEVPPHHTDMLAFLQATGYREIVHVTYRKA